MKRIILFLTVLLSSTQIWAQTVTINESSGWLESAFVKWAPVSGASSYNVYYTGGGQTNKKIDTQLIRSYGSYYRADVPGLAAGTYTLTVKPVVSGTEGTGATTGSLTVSAQDRNGFAFDSGRVPGGYTINGTPKSGAIIFYITQNTKNTISYDIITSSSGAKTNYVGLQNILYGIKKGYDTRPFIIRLIGNITDMTVMEGGDVVIENSQNANSYVTIEGVGNDAVANGWGVRLKSASNIEVSNLGFMNCDSTAGDNVGMQQDNDHVWVHNCDLFYGDAGSDADQIKGDGALDNKSSTYITMSYNHFWDNGKASLLGLSEDTTVGLYITYHHNWFDHSDSRHPRVRFYSAHVYNNYYDGNAKYGAGSTMGSSIFMEGNFFRNCKYPMLTSKQGTDIYYDSVGTFSGEAGGTIKSFNNTMSGQTRYVPYNASTNPIEFDAIEAGTRGEIISSSITSKLGGNAYNNFDTNAALYVKNLVVDDPATAKTKAMQYAGRVSGGDLKWTFNNAVDDASSTVIAALKSALTNYASTLVSVQGETTPAGSQTLTSTANNNQTVTSGTAISSIVFTWGGDATDASVTGLPASGISFVKNTTAKTITITGTPTASVSYSIATSGTSGTPATGSGIITVTTAGSQTLTATANNNQTVTSGNAISSIVYTWGGDATDATVTGLPASGISFVKNTTAKTITISGTPTATVSYSIATSGTAGTPATGSGTITVTTGGTSGDEIHNFTISGKVSAFYAITGNMNSTDGLVTYNGLTLTKRLKMESSTSINFTTAAASTVTLVFDATFTGTVLINGVSYTASAGIVTASLPAGANAITKGATTNLFYISTEYDTVSNPQTLTSTANNNQTVPSGTAIGSIVYTWGGDATDATVTGLPASGISFVKNTAAKTITLSGNPTANVSYSISTIGAGTPATGSGTITVTVQTLTATANTNQTIASGTAISPIVYTWGGDATDATVTGLPASGISFVKDTVAKTITISGTPTASVSYSISTIGAGTSVTGSGSITLAIQTLTATANTNQTVPSGTAIGSIVYTWGGSATDATVSGLPASGVSFVKNTTAKTITISGNPTANVSYSVSTSGAGTPVTGSGNITVTVQTLTSTANNNQTVASGTAISSIVYTWGGDATDATVTGLPASGISFVKNTTAKTITISGNPTANVSYSVSTSGAGTPVTGSGNITVTVQTLTSTANNNQTVASGTAISSIVYTWGGDATDATVTGLPASGISFVKNTTAKTITISGTPTANVSYSVSTSGTGTSVSGSGTITVTATVPGDQIHNFTTSGKVSAFYTITGNMNSTDGSVTYNGLTLTKRLKIETSTTINYTTTAASTLTLVFDSNFVGTIKVNNVSYTAIAGIVTASLPAGSYSITKGAVANLFYIETKFNTSARMAQNTKTVALLGTETVENSETTQLVLYPNPVTNTLYLSNSNEKVENVLIYNMAGRLVRSSGINTESVDMSNLSSGTYLVKVNTDQGPLDKVIIKK